MIEIFIITFVLSFLLSTVFYFLKYKLKVPYDPFGYSQIIVTTLICKECGTKGIRLFQQDDYVFKVHEKCPRCKKGDFVIVGIFWEKPKTKEELKYEQLIRKWK